MVIKPIEFAMIQQQNNVSKSQHNIETRPMAEQQAITQQVEKNAEHNSQQVNKKDKLIMRMPIMMQKIKVIMNTVMTESTLVRKKTMAGLL